MSRKERRQWFWVGTGILLTMIVFLIIPVWNQEQKLQRDRLEEHIAKIQKDRSLLLQEPAMIRRLYHIDQTSYEKGLLMKAEGAMNVEEIAVFYVADDAQRDRVIQACQTRTEEQIKSFTGYGETQVAILKQAQLKAYGTTIVFIISGDADALLQQLIEGALI